MGNEIRTVAGVGASAVTVAANGVTFGQVEAINTAAANCLDYTAEAASSSMVRHAGEAVLNYAYAGVVGTAAVATLEQSDRRNLAVVECVAGAATSFEKTVGAVGETANDLANDIPLVGHAKGALHYMVGDEKGGDLAMKNASHTTGAMIGGIADLAGTVAGGIEEGASADSIAAVVESIVRD